MKNSYFAKTLMPAGFAIGLFASQQSFILATPDNLNQIGKGLLEAGSGDSVQVQITLRGKEFAGSGIMTSTPPKQNKTLRSDRSFMESLGMSHLKHGFASLNAKDGSTLSCEFNVKNEQVDGRCVNPVDQQTLTVRSSTGNQP